MTPSFKSRPDVSQRLRWLPQAELDGVLNMRPEMSVAEINSAAPVPTEASDRVLMANLWSELADPLATLGEVKRLLREDGRLILIEWHADAEFAEAPPNRVPLQEMVLLLEHNGWDIHRHGDIGPHCYFLEAGVADESVQS